MSTSAPTMDKTISYDDYLKLRGLLTLAAEHNRALRNIGHAAAQITGEGDDGYGYYGCTTDAISDENPDPGHLLMQLKITVEPEIAPAEVT